MEKELFLEKIAVLIDADNSQSTKLKAVFDEISTYGRIVVKKAYGDWNNPCLKNWEETLKTLAIKPVQQLAYTKGKNATDIALAIDAMDLLSTGIYDAFAVVSSDSDYTPLVIRLRESGIYIFGAGERKTPTSFVNACDNFIRTDRLMGNDSLEGRTADKEQENTALVSDASPANDIDNIHRLLRIANEKYQDDDGWVNVSSAGTYIKRVLPDFEAKSYGYSKITDLLKDFPKKYELTKYAGKGKGNIIAYKLK